MRQILRNKAISVALVLTTALLSLAGCGKSIPRSLEGRYYCPEKDSNSYVLDFNKDGTVDTYYSGKGTYSIDDKGVFKLDISIIHGTGTVNEDGSIDFNTTDNLSYHYIPEAARPEKELSTEETFNATLMLDRMPYEYNRDSLKVSELQTDDDGCAYYQLSNDGSTITGTVGVDKNFTANYGIPTTPEESITELMEKGIKGSNKYFENSKYYLTLMLSGYTDTNCAVYYMYLIPKESNTDDTNTYYAALYFYNKDLHTSLEEFTGIKNGINYIAGGDIFEYTFQDAMNSLSTLRAQM